MEMLELAVSIEREPRLAGSGVDAREEIILAIAQGFDDPSFTITDVALAVGISERRVRNILAEHDQSFMGEVLNRRMIKARWLLVGSPNTVNEIAFLCGYRCPSSFAARFRDVNGMTPRAWRESEGGPVRVSRTRGRRAASSSRRPRPTRGEREMLAHEERHAERRARLRLQPQQNASQDQ
jgi:AraC-like DNA-binding protein